MELRHLRYFVAVAEECHFGRAAERLHIAQPPLSQQIMQLETELGVRLLSRSTRKVEPTPAGASYLEHARQILAAVDLAREEASRVASGEVGRLAIGFTGSATYELLPTLARMLEGVVEQPGDLGRGEQLAAQVEQQVRQRREPLVAVLPERGR